jgi:hypothetical protein
VTSFERYASFIGISPPGTRYVFMNERGIPLSAAGFRKMLSIVGAACGLPSVHPHMLRHSCGFYMADSREDVRVMQDWLGHANVQNTVRYSACRFSYRCGVPAQSRRECAPAGSPARTRQTPRAFETERGPPVSTACLSRYRSQPTAFISARKPAMGRCGKSAPRWSEGYPLPAEAANFSN